MRQILVDIPSLEIIAKRHCISKVARRSQDHYESPRLIEYLLAAAKDLLKSHFSKGALGTLKCQANAPTRLIILSILFPIPGPQWCRREGSGGAQPPSSDSKGAQSTPQGR